MAPKVVVRGDLIRQGGSGTDKGHIAHEHTDELRQFVNLGSTQEPPDGCNLRVVERDELHDRIDSKYGYFKLFISPASGDALKGILESIQTVMEEMKKVPVAPDDDRVKQTEEFLTFGKGQGKIVDLTEDALRAVQKSAEEDLRFAFEIPFTSYVIGEGKRRAAPPSNESD